MVLLGFISKTRIFHFFLILDTHTHCPLKYCIKLCSELEGNSTVWWPGLVSAGGRSSEIGSRYSLTLFFQPLLEVCSLNEPHTWLSLG